MSILSARLLFRVDPLPHESPRGYLCRVAHAQGYGGPLLLAQIAGLPRSGLERDANAKQLAHLLRLEPEEWRAMCYRHINGRTRYDQRLFCGERISADDLNYRRPRLCPRCLGERAVWWAVWDLGLVTTCPIHHCHLLNQCPACKRMLAWQRPAVHECRCGLDLRTVPPEAATADLVAINAVIYRATGFSPGPAAERDLTDCGFPPEMLKLKLGALLRLILFMGAIREKDRLRQKQRPFAATDLVAATEITRAAVTLLREWPRPLREVLRHMLPPESTHPAAFNFNEILGNFYRHLFRVLPRSEFGFLHDAFERFVIEDWKGLIRGQHRYFSTAVRRSSPWVAATEAERIARIGGGKILDLVHDGHLEALIVDVRPGGSRTECWIRRESLNRWIAARDAELAPYMSRREARGTLGLTICTIVKVAAAGAIRYVEGPEQNFPTGFFFFLREDVMKIKHAFEKHAAPVMHYSKPDEVITLRHAIKNYLGRGSALAAVISAVVDGSLVPVGYATGGRGITGYLFRSEELRKYRPVPEVKPHPEIFLNFREAASVLSIKRNVVRDLVAQGLLGLAAGYRNGFAKLVPEKDVRCFAESYVSTSVLAKRFHLNSGSLARHLKESGTPLLAIPDPDPGRGHAYFLRKDVAAQIRLPTRRMLREESQRRMKAERKRKWAEYRLAQESATGKPMRRVRATRPVQRS
jgi:TniQ